MASRTEEVSKDVICLNGSSRTTSSSAGRNIFRTGLASSINQFREMRKLCKPLKAAKQTIADTMKTNNKRAMLAQSFVGTRTDVSMIRICHCVVLLSLMRRVSFC